MIQTTAYWNQKLASILAELIASGGFAGPLNGLTLALVSNPVLLTPNTVWSDLVESTFSGYARVTDLGWGVPILQPDGTYTILSDLSTFTAAATSNFVQGSVYGWALIDTSASPNFLMGEMFAQQIPITNPGDGFGLVIEFNVLPPNVNSFGTVLA